jgi:hypothetical protein
MANPGRYIMRLRSSVKAPAVLDICKELNGTFAGSVLQRRFKGACVSSIPKVGGAWCGPYQQVLELRSTQATDV